MQYVLYWIDNYDYAPTAVHVAHGRGDMPRITIYDVPSTSWLMVPPIGWDA